jgi:hypothetical protein
MVRRLFAGASRIRTLGPTPSLAGRQAARTRPTFPPSKFSHLPQLMIVQHGRLRHNYPQAVSSVMFPSLPPGGRIISRARGT